MRAKYPVLNTRLYETLAAVLPKNRHKKLRDSLQSVWDMGTRWHHQTTRITMAFTWNRTPQGRDFWHELSYYEAFGWKKGRKEWLKHLD